MKYISYLFALIALIFVSFYADAAHAAGAAQMRVKLDGQADSAYTTHAEVSPGGTIWFRMFYLGDAATATNITVDFPTDLNFKQDSTTVLSGNAATVTEVDAHTIKWTFAPSAAELMTFGVTVSSGSTLSATHSRSLTFTTNGNPASSDSVTVRTGPIVTDVTPSSNSNNSAQLISVTGHGLIGATGVSLSDGTVLNLTGAAITDTSISGASLKIPALKPVGEYYVLVSVTANGAVLTTKANDIESAKYTVVDGVPPTMITDGSTENTYAHATGSLVLNFNEAIDASRTAVANIYLADALTGGNSTNLTGATVDDVDATPLSITLTESLKNMISGWGKTSPTLYARIAASGVFDVAGNQLSSQASRTALNTWSKDIVKPSVANFSVSQNNEEKTSFAAGVAHISLSLSESLAVAPLVTVTQQGSAAITNASLVAGVGNVYTYDYTVNANDGSAYIDGQATVTITTGEDSAGNVMDNSVHTFTVDTTGPSTSVESPASSGETPNSVALSWTPAYTESDFGSYKIYYDTSTGVTSSTPDAAAVTASSNSSLGSSSTNSVTISGLAANTTYYFAIYVCDKATNCSTASDEISATTASEASVVIAPPSPSPGGGGGYVAPSAISTSKTISPTGGSLSTKASGGSTATITLSSGALSAASAVSITETTTIERDRYFVSPSVGIRVGGGMYVISVTQNGTKVTSFKAPVSLRLTYTQADAIGVDAVTLRAGRYDTVENKWHIVNSSVDPASRAVSLLMDGPGIYALIAVAPDVLAAEPISGITIDTGHITTEDNGIIAGTAVGAYPNGTLLKSPDSSAVWYIENGAKRLITSSRIFETRFDWKNVITLPSSRQLDVYQPAEPLGFATGALVKEEGSPSVFRVAQDGALQPIVSADVFARRGYSFGDVVEVAPGLLGGYARSTILDDAEELYTGDLIKFSDNPTVYYVDSGTLRAFLSESIFKRNKLNFSRVRTIDRSRGDGYAVGDPMAYPDGMLVKSDTSSVYVVSGGKRRPITSAADFEALLYRWQDVIYVPDHVLSHFEIGAPMQIIGD